MKFFIGFVFLFFSYFTVLAQNTVGLTGTALNPVFSPGGSFPVIRISTNTLNLSPVIDSITISRTGTSTDGDVPTAKLFRDLDTNDVVDSPTDTQVGSTGSFSGGSVTFGSLNYVPSALENLLIVFDVDPGATTTNTCGASMGSSDIVGAAGTTVTFPGVTMSNQPLPVQLISFKGTVSSSSILLEWRTATETDNFGFEIQRRLLTASATAFAWSKIGFVYSAPSTSDLRSYTFRDEGISPGRYAYQVTAIDHSGARSASLSIEIYAQLPTEAVLLGNYPNPFNPSTTISYALPVRSNMKLQIIDLLGRTVANLMDGEFDAGYHQVTWNAHVASGIYFYRIEAVAVGEPSKRFVETKKMILLK